MVTLSRFLGALMLAAASAAVATGPQKSSGPADPAIVVGTCAPVMGRDWLPTSGVILFGEFHGTREPAALFSDLVCARLADPDAPRLLVALEMPESLNRVFASTETDHPEARIAALRRHPFWQQFGDGRSGASGLALAEWLLREHLRQPDRLHVRAFQVPNIDVAGAALIRDAKTAVAATQTLVFTGNAHARKVPIPGQQEAALGQSLRDAGLSVTSLNLRHGGGQAWFCFPPCALRDLPEMPGGGVRRIEREAVPGDGAYDGWYYVPKLSVSAPALEPEAR